MSTVEGSLTFGKFIDSLLDTSIPFKVTKREVTKPWKLLTIAIAGLVLKERQEGELDDFIKQKDGLKQHSSKLLECPEYKTTVEQTSEWFSLHLEFNPTASVIGSVASQEIIKVITRKDFPAHGLFLYDSTI